MPRGSNSIASASPHISTPVMSGMAIATQTLQTPLLLHDEVLGERASVANVKRPYALMLCFAALVSCTPERERQDRLTPAGKVLPAEASNPPRFAVARIEEAKRDLLEKPTIGDLIHDGLPNRVDWQVGTFGIRAPAYDYADDICAELKGWGLVDADTDVRISDLDDPKAQAGDLPAASLGRVECATGVRNEYR